MAGPAGALHRARGRLQRRADRARKRRPQRGDDGADAAARRSGRLDAVIEFAELEEFVDLKLKNYSSGMLVRLAFSLMMQADADVLLIDEVLAVGDAAFQQKCADAFHEMKAAGQDDRPRHPRHGRRSRRYCHRAMLIDDGEIAARSATRPRSARQYLRLNFERGRRSGADAGGEPARPTRSGCSTPGLENAAGERGGAGRAGRGDPAVGPSSRACSDMRRRRASASCVANADGVGIFEFGTAGRRRAPAASSSRPGSGSTVDAELENPLVAGPLLRPLRRQPRPTGRGRRPLRPQRDRLRRLRRPPAVGGDGRPRARDRGRGRGGRGRRERRGRCSPSCARSGALGARRRLRAASSTCSG